MNWYLKRLIGQSERQKRIGLFGGAFHPPHPVHLKLAREASADFDLDAVFFIPSGTPPHKNIKGLSAEQRLFLTEVAVSSLTPLETEKKLKDFAFFEEGKKKRKFMRFYKKQYYRRLFFASFCAPFFVSDFEVKRKETSFSIDTVMHFAHLFPNTKLFLLIGADQAAKFETWKDYKSILNLTTVLVAGRDGEKTKKIFEKFPEMKKIAMKENPASSTKIRALSSQKELKKAIGGGLSLLYLEMIKSNAQKDEIFSKKSLF